MFSLTTLETVPILQFMVTKRLPRPRDPIALAKLIGDIATGQVVDSANDAKDEPAAKNTKKSQSKVRKSKQERCKG